MPTLYRIYIMIAIYKMHNIMIAILYDVSIDIMQSLYYNVIKGQADKPKNLDETSETPERSGISPKDKKGKQSMKSYLLKVDGFTVGIVELYPEEVKEMSKDTSIIIKEVNENV